MIMIYLALTLMGDMKVAPTHTQGRKIRKPALQNPETTGKENGNVIEIITEIVIENVIDTATDPTDKKNLTG